MDSRQDRRGNYKYLVFWVGHPTPQWLPLEQLSNAKAILQDFYEQNPEPGGTPLVIQDFLQEEPTLTEQLFDSSEPGSD